MSISVCDLCDAHEEQLQVAEPVFNDYGGRLAFSGEIETVKCHEDNSLVKELVATPGRGRVLVVDGGGSLRRSLLGDQLAAKALHNEWSGIVIFGAIRDIEVIGTLEIGVKALNVIPVKTEKRGLGDQGVPVTFAGVTFKPGNYLYADSNGLVISDHPLD